MKKGDLVRHKKRGKLGIVLSCHTKKNISTTQLFAKVHWLGDSTPRYIREHRMEVVNECG
jgi:hypothetical protein